MRKYQLALGITFVIVFAFIYSESFDFASSIVPGWHTTIYPLWFILLVLVVPIVIIALLIKLFIKRK
jgi:DMSO reductase anchor subunit